jgi:CDP-diacylglycerol--glycerol-3-phosphate 3-phosphatidyltransferase
MDAIEHIRQWVRYLVRQVARALNAVTAGYVTPNMVTWTGLLLHFIVAWLIIKNQWPAAAGALVIFGLFDTLDGELARIQQKASDFGMVLDASTDRIKEAILYGSIGYWFATQGDYTSVIASFSALASSFSVSYVKAKAETAISAGTKNASAANRRYNEGFARFEIRITLLVIALFSSQLAPILWLITGLSIWTYWARLNIIRKDLSAKN